MEELITLNQLKAYDDEKTNIWHNNFTTGNLSANNLGADNAVMNNVNAVDLNVANNFVTDNAVMNNATVTDLNVTNLVAAHANIDIDNGTANNFNVVNLVSTNAEIDNGNVNNLNAGNMSINNLFVDNLIANEQGLYVDDLTVNNSATLGGFDVTSMTVIPEDDYNNLGAEARNSAFYVTSPNGNMYLYGIKYAATSIKKEYIANVSLPNMANNMQTLTTSTLTFTSGAVTNSFVNNGAYSGIKETTPFETYWNNSAPIGTQANTGNIITNAKELYITDATRMYMNCINLTDTFITNPSLITGAPVGYDPMKYCTSMWGTFNRCSNFNQPVTIPDSVTDMSFTFDSCINFNQPVIIGNNVTKMQTTFNNCINFNQPVIIPDSVTRLDGTFGVCLNFNQPVIIGNNVSIMLATFSNCRNFNQPVIIPDSVTEMNATFRNCINFNQPVIIGNNVTNISRTFQFCNNFNQPVTIPDSVTRLQGTFEYCNTLANSTVPIHISHNIALGDTSNHIYNCLVNNYTGINWTGRILNDA